MFSGIISFLVNLKPIYSQDALPLMIFNSCKVNFCYDGFFENYLAIIAQIVYV